MPIGKRASALAPTTRLSRGAPSITRQWASASGTEGVAFALLSSPRRRARTGTNSMSSSSSGRTTMSGARFTAPTASTTTKHSWMRPISRPRRRSTPWAGSGAPWWGASPPVGNRDTPTRSTSTTPSRQAPSAARARVSRAPREASSPSSTPASLRPHPA